MRIAMWSGPRNLSTALMYAFGARADCAVVDEPFYAAYLARTGLSHPMRQQILAAQCHDPDTVAAQITGSNPGEMAHYYQKHMAHHMLPGIDLGWMSEVKNVFLIRHPARVIASYAAKRKNPNLDDLGFRQQAELFEQTTARGLSPIVIDSSDIRANPKAALTGLCNALGLKFDPAMLSWPAGGHADDGVWASHWYGAVHRSTGFAGPEQSMPRPDQRAKALAEQALPYYAAMVHSKL